MPKIFQILDISQLALGYISLSSGISQLALSFQILSFVRKKQHFYIIRDTIHQGIILKYFKKVSILADGGGQSLYVWSHFERLIPNPWMCPAEKTSMILRMIWSWFGLILVDSSWFRLIQVDSGWFGLIPVDSSWLRLICINTGWYGLIQVYFGWFWLVQVDSGWF